MKTDPLDSISLQFRDRRRWFCAGHDVHDMPRVWACAPHRDKAISRARAEAEIHVARFPIDGPVEGWHFKTWAPSRGRVPFEPA